MQFKVESRIGVVAPPERLWSFISDLASWDHWNPVETGVSGAVGYGGAVTLTERIPGLTERAVTAKVRDWTPNSQLVWIEKRGFLFTVARFYEIEPLGPENCILANGVIYSGLRGELAFDKQKKAIKPAVVAISEALKTAAEAV